MTEALTPPPEPAEPAADPRADTLEALEGALDALREHHPERVPQWEYCEGVLTALLCMRRTVPPTEWLPLLFDGDDVFASEGERTQFMMHWLAREAQLRAQLQAPVEALDDEQALEPGVIDWRGLLASLPEDERAAATAEGTPPPIAQAWAGGFIDAVDYWAEDWAPPRDKEIAAQMDDALDCIATLLEEDREAPKFNLFDEHGAPSVSQARFEAYGEAIWAVYDLFDIARSLGPRIAPARSDKVGRNDPCPCGSGKKFKKCCGA